MASSTSNKNKTTKAKSSTKIQAKQVEVLTGKLEAFNEEAEQCIEDASKVEDESQEDGKFIKLCETFIRGQGTLYVLEKQNKEENQNGLSSNGPAFEERLWNARELKMSAVQSLAQINGGRLYPKLQEYAIIIAVSSSLLQDVELAKYASHEFPNIVFRAGVAGKIFIINGHHRIAALIFKHLKLLQTYEGYKKLLKHPFGVANDNDTSEIVEAREKCATLEATLFGLGGWGAIILDYDKIVAHVRRQEIQAYWARNIEHFHVPDTPADLLHLILKSVKSMSPEDGFEFLQYQLSRSGSKCKIQLQSILKNPQLLYLFADLTTVPMFESVKLINFHQIYKWRKIVPCWLEIFLKFAQDSYRYIASPLGARINSILDLETPSNIAYPIFDLTFHDIIDEAYKTHLVPAFLAFGTLDGKILVKGKEMANWTESFAKYRNEILEKLANWSENDGRPAEYHSQLSVLVERVTYILDDAYQIYPCISHLNAPLPLACKTFIQDIATDLEGIQDQMLEFLALFEPTIATRFGYRKKADAILDLAQMFKQFATMPYTGIAKDKDWVDPANILDFETQFAEIWALLFCSRKTAISAVGTLDAQTKHLRSEPILASSVKSESTNRDCHIALGLTEILNAWVKAQRQAEMKMTMLPADQQSFLEKDSKKNGCALPPAIKLMPKVSSFKFQKAHALDDKEKGEIEECLAILGASYHSWSAQSTSMPLQHHTGLAVNVLQLSRDAESIYAYYLGETAIWELYIKIQDIVRKFSPSFEPWHRISTAEYRSDNPHQIILSKSFHGEEIGLVFGAGMADKTESINQQYHTGLQKTCKAILDMSCHHHEGKKYISSDVLRSMKALFHSLAKECVNQCFQYEHDQRYVPLENISEHDLDVILEERLQFKFPSPEVHLMSSKQLSNWYGGDGMENTFGLLHNALYGAQTVKEEELKRERRAAQLIARKARKRNTKAETDAINRIDPDSSDSDTPPSTTQPGPSKKKARKAPSKQHRESPLPKKLKQQDGPDSDVNMTEASPKSQDKPKNPAHISGSSKGKEKETVLAPDSDEEAMSPPSSPTGA